MSRFILRLDDASDYMDILKWKRMEALLDKYHIQPIFGIIPLNRDESLVNQYIHNDDFWDLMHSWIGKGWIPAMHGYEHRYVTNEGGLNPINKRSEFAGLPYEVQAKKIREGYAILCRQGIYPEIFFAPSHTFDKNTLKAIKNETPIRIISDTIAFDVYKEGDFWFIPQQSGVVRKLPFRLITFCYHPNTMDEKAFEKLEAFLSQEEFISFTDVLFRDRSLSVLDRLLKVLYFFKHSLLNIER